METKTCAYCKKTFEKGAIMGKRWERKKYCNFDCYNNYRKEFQPRKGIKFSEEVKKNMSRGQMGKYLGPHSEEHKRKISEAQKGEKGHWFGKKHDEETKAKMSASANRKYGEDNINWKGDEIKCGGIHHWLTREYGQPQRCDNPKCPYKNIKRYDWANVHGHVYERDRAHFIRLCRGCHLKYDKHELTIKTYE